MIYPCLCLQWFVGTLPVAVPGGDPQPHSWGVAFFACAFRDRKYIPLSVAVRDHVCGTTSALVQTNFHLLWCRQSLCIITGFLCMSLQR